MRKKTIQKSFISIIGTSSLSKFFALLSKIVLTNTLGIKIMSIFGLINPLMILVITISSFSLPNVLSYLISSNRKKSKSYIKASFLIIFIISILFSTILFLFAEEIALIFFHNKDVIESIKALCLLIPLVSFSSLLKGYFLGVKEVSFSTSSQLFEESSRLLFNLFLIDLLITDNNARNASILVISLCIGEVAQSLYLIIFAHKKYQKNYKKLFIKSDETLPTKEICNIALPLTLSRLIGSITYFFEPVIITTILTKLNYPIDMITYDYGILTSYIMSLLLLPGFFSLALSNYLLPHLSYHISNNDYEKAKKIFKEILLYCFFIGLFFSILFFFFGNTILKLLYNIDLDNDKFKLLSFPFLIYYLETPINIAMSAFNLTKQAFLTTIISCLIRIILLFVFTPVLGVDSASISTFISCLILVTFNGVFIYKSFLRYKIKSSIK